MPRSGTLFLAFVGLTCFRCFEVLRWSSTLQTPLEAASSYSNINSPHDLLRQKTNRAPLLTQADPSKNGEELYNGKHSTSPKINAKSHKDQKKTHAAPVEFTWKDLNTKKKTKCGNEKCFFPSKSDPKGTGYVVSSAIRKKGILRAWSIAQDIDRLLLTENTNKSSWQKGHTDKISYHQTRHHFYRKEPIERIGFPKKVKKRMGPIRMGKSQALMVQEVDLAPLDDLIVLGCSNSRIEESWKKLTSILLKPYSEEESEEIGDDNINVDYSTNNDEKGDFSWESDKDWELTEEMIKAIHTFSRSINNTLHVLEVFPGLNADFQVFVNRYGEIFHFDLDRGRLPPPDDEIRICQCNLRMMSMLMEQVVSHMVTPRSGDIRPINHKIDMVKNRTAHLLEIAWDGQAETIQTHLLSCKEGSYALFQPKIDVTNR